MRTPWQQMSGSERFGWILGHWVLAIPVLIIIAAYVAMTFPLFAPLPVVPNFALLLVLLWALYRPAQLPPWTGFIVGLAGDIFLGTPFGANALLVPVFILAVAGFDTRVKRETWLADWLFAIPAIFVYHLLLWKLCGWIAAPIPFLPLFSQAAATLAVYPVIGLLFVGAQRKWAAG